MPPAGQVSDVGGVPQQVKSFEEVNGPGPVPNSQSTTKPRQMPSGGGGGMDPNANGSDVGTGMPPVGGPPAPPPMQQPNPPMQASRHESYLLADLINDIRTTNPHLGGKDAFRLARRVLDEYPMARVADGWNALDYGGRGKVPDGPLTRWLYHHVTKQRPTEPPPDEEPPEEQPPEEQPPEGTENKPQPQAEPEPQEEPQPQPQAGPRPRKMVQQPDGTWDWDRPLTGAGAA